MCQKKLSEGVFFIRIGNMGNPDNSAGYDCFHSNDLFKLPEMVANTLGEEYFKDDPDAFLTNFVINLLARCSEKSWLAVQEQITKIRNKERPYPKIIWEKMNPQTKEVIATNTTEEYVQELQKEKKRLKKRK